MSSNVVPLRTKKSVSNALKSGSYSAKRLQAVKETLHELLEYLTSVPAAELDMQKRMALGMGKPMLFAYIEQMNEEAAEAFETLLRNVLQRLDSKQ